MNERDLYQELRTMGFTSDQCSEILDWTEKLPIKKHRNIIVDVSIEQGVVEIKHHVEYWPG